MFCFGRTRMRAYQYELLPSWPRSPSLTDHPPA